MDRGAWWATVHGVAKSGTRLSDFTFTVILNGLSWKRTEIILSILRWHPSTLKRLSTMQKTRVHALSWADPLEKEMARVNVDILGISKLKWTGMGEFNSDDHYIYYCGQESLRRNGSSHHGQQKSPKCSTWMQSQK